MMMIAENQIIPMKIIIKLRIMEITHEVFTLAYQNQYRSFFCSIGRGRRGGFRRGRGKDFCNHSSSPSVFCS
jgi:hypothetical protein